MGARQLLLGIDIGTSACKVAAFYPDGKIAGLVSESYPIHYPYPCWAEQDPDDWWIAVCKAIRRLLAEKIQPQELCGIGVDGQSWGAVAVDATGAPLCRTPIWLDTRSSAECIWMKATCGEDAIFQVSGNPVQPTYTTPKVLWYKNHIPEVYHKTAQILQSNSFIVHRLTGVFSQEHSQGYGWSCYHMQNCCWDKELCQSLGLSSALLPPLFESHAIVGGVNQHAAAETGLLVGTPVVAGGLDAACGALGAGVIHVGQTQEQGGQAGGMSICIDRPQAEKSLILSPHVVPKRWLLQGGTVGGGGAVNWFLREFGAAERSAAVSNETNPLFEMDSGAQQILPGSDGLIFLPYLAGERSPLWNTQAKGVFYGIDFSKTRAHFARAVMEGVAYSLRHNLEVAASVGAPAETLRAMGGAANSQLWTQIKSDVTGRAIEVPSADTATALGAAILAGVGVGIYPNFERAVAQTVRLRRSYRPNPKNAAAYDEGYKLYRTLYTKLKSLMNGNAMI